ncbi:stage II sporulation protein M [Alteribacillus persepolensis]|uniref:Stage II sporulation protein M n=1 Tax=Alteribacillus persepolensis TaxID=568899 RepID=A0A1G7ZPE1_9BACI|nr:stage II sporulation protein M [Alteribacillus persepolensis]SDH10573.1 stage II sporulation protein M [Alteribacillus persepolensis]
MFQTMSLLIQKHWFEYRSFYWFSLILLFMGIVFGAVMVNSLSLGLKNDLYHYLQQFLTQFQSGTDITPKHIFLQSISHHAGYVGLMWVLGLSVAGVPFILILLFLKGVVAGFTIGFLVQQMGSSGFFLAFASILPQNIIVIPAYIIMAVTSVGISLSIIKHLFKQTRTTPVPAVILRSLVISGAILLLLGAAAAIEGFLSPVMMKNVLEWTT